MKPDNRNILSLLKVLPSLLMAILMSCQGEKKPQNEITAIRPYKSVDKVSDTVFFTLIGKMTGVNEFAMLDANEKRLIICEQDLKLKKVISRRGKGPGELVYPSACYVFNDLYVPNDSEVIIYELNTMAFHFFGINTLLYE